MLGFVIFACLESQSGIELDSSTSFSLLLLMVPFFFFWFVLISKGYIVIIFKREWTLQVTYQDLNPFSLKLVTQHFIYNLLYIDQFWTFLEIILIKCYPKPNIWLVLYTCEFLLDLSVILPCLGVSDVRTYVRKYIFSFIHQKFCLWEVQVQELRIQCKYIWEFLVLNLYKNWYSYR